MFREGGRVGNYIYRFGKGPRYAVSGGRLALADTERFSVRSIALGDGSAKWILRRDEPAREVTSEDVEAAVEVSMSLTRGVEGMPEGAREGLRRNMSQSPTASTLPVLQSLHLDALGGTVLAPRHGPSAVPGLFAVRHLAGDHRNARGAFPRAAIGAQTRDRAEIGLRNRRRLHPRRLAGRAGRGVRAVVRAGEARPPQRAEVGLRGEAGAPDGDGTRMGAVPA